MSDFRSKMNSIYQNLHPNPQEEIELTEAVCIPRKQHKILRGFQVVRHMSGIHNIEINETAPRIFDTLTQLLETLQPRPLGEVDIRIRSHHETGKADYVILYCGWKERLIIDSTLVDYEDMLTHDGFMAIQFTSGCSHVLLTERKTIEICTSPIKVPIFKQVLKGLQIPEHSWLQTAAMEDHTSRTTPHRKEMFKEMCQHFGADSEEDGEWWQNA